VSLLHTEVAALRTLAGDASAREADLEAADRLARRSGDAAFQKRRLLALGYWNQEWARLGTARYFYRLVLAAHPRDPEALVATGTIYEELDAMGPGWGTMEDASDPLARATELYRRAVAGKADYAEARLRLGRVLALQGHRKPAREELAQVFASSPGPEIKAFAHLFLGEIEQDEGHLDRAIEQFRLAREADPRLQPAYLSLSQALHRAGRTRAAAAAMLEGLRSTAGGEVHAWFGYHANVLHGYRLTLDALWKETQ
jgi:tetratricopeptide (TPR) repeat protein